MSETLPQHPLNSYGQFFLMEIAESANPPNTLPDLTWENITMDARDGWKVVFFYDGDLDYIDYFITPTGAILEVFDFDRSNPAYIYEGSLPPIMNWRGVGDMQRLKEAYGL